MRQINVASAPRIALDQARELVRRGRAIFVDVRSPADYQEGHIPGARLLPLIQIARRGASLPRDKTIITY